jgi:hypothetical protein
MPTSILKQGSFQQRHRYGDLLEDVLFIIDASIF